MTKRLVAIAFAALGVLGFSLASAQAAPGVTVCHGITVSVNGTELINDAGCNHVPPDEG